MPARMGGDVASAITVVELPADYATDILPSPPVPHSWREA
jgi:hypothetical protein